MPLKKYDDCSLFYWKNRDRFIYIKEKRVVLAKAYLANSTVGRQKVPDGLKWLPHFNHKEGLSGSRGSPWEPIQRQANALRNVIFQEIDIDFKGSLVCIPTEDRGRLNLSLKTTMQRTEDLITSGSLAQNYGFTGVSIK